MRASCTRLQEEVKETGAGLHICQKMGREKHSGKTSPSAPSTSSVTQDHFLLLRHKETKTETNQNHTYISNWIRFKQLARVLNAMLKKICTWMELKLVSLKEKTNNAWLCDNKYYMEKVHFRCIIKERCMSQERGVQKSTNQLSFQQCSCVLSSYNIYDIRDSLRSYSRAQGRKKQASHNANYMANVRGIPNQRLDFSYHSIWWTNYYQNYYITSLDKPIIHSYQEGCSCNMLHSYSVVGAVWGNYIFLLILDLTGRSFF